MAHPCFVLFFSRDWDRVWDRRHTSERVLALLRRVLYTD